MRTYVCPCVPAGDNHADARCGPDWVCAGVYALCCHRDNIFLLIPLDEHRGIVAGSDYGYSWTPIAWVKEAANKSTLSANLHERKGIRRQVPERSRGMSSCGDPIHCERAAEVKASIAVGPGTSLQALEFAEVRKEGNNCSNGRMKHEKEQGSESVNEEPRSHTCRTRRRTKCCGVEVS